MTTNFDSTYSSPVENIFTFVPLVPTKVQGGLVVPLRPPLAGESRYDFSEKRFLVIPPPSLENELAERVNEEMQTFFKENHVQFASLLKECRIEGRFDQPQLSIGNEGVFKQRMEELAESLKEKILKEEELLEEEELPLEEGELTLEEEIQQLVTHQFLQEALSSLCWDRALEDLEETKITLMHSISNISEKISVNRQCKEALRLTDLFLKASKDHSFKETKMFQARQLTWQNRALQAQIEGISSLKEKNAEEAYEECKRDLLNIFKEAAASKGKEIRSEAALYDEIRKNLLYSPKKTWSSWLSDVPMLQRSVPEQDYADFIFTERYQEKIGSLHVRLNQWAPVLEKLHLSKELVEEFQELHALVEVVHQMTSFRVSYFVQEEELEDSIDHLTSQAIDWKNYSPIQYQKVCEALSRMHQLANEYRERKPSAKVLEEIEKKVQWQTQFTLRELEDFMDELDEEMDAELKESQAQKAGEPLKTLRRDCLDFIAALEEIQKEFSLPEDAKKQIQKDLEHLHKQWARIEEAYRQALREKWEDKLISAEVLSSEKKRRVAEKIAQDIEQSDWSDASKRLIHTLFVGMQLTQDLQRALKLPEDARQLKTQADILQKQMLQNVPEETQASIKKEMSIIGRLLSDQYDVLKKPGSQEDIQRKYPHIRQTLKAAVQQFGDTAPSREQIGLMMDTHQMNRLLGESMALNPSLQERIGTWWTLFTEGPQEIQEQKADVALKGLPAGKVQTALSPMSETSQSARPQSFLVELARELGLSGIISYLNKGSQEGRKATHQDDRSLVVEKVSVLTQEIEQLKEFHSQLDRLREQFEAISPSLSEQPQLEALGNELKQLESKLTEFKTQAPDKKALRPSVHAWLAKFNEYKNEVEGISKTFEKLNLEKQIEAVELLKRTIEGKAIPIDNTMLLHVLGDIFGKGTGLEGYDPLSVLNFREMILSNKIDALSSTNHPLQNLLEWAGITMKEVKASDERKILEQIQKAILIQKMMPLKTEVFAAYLKQQLEILKPNESIFFPGGWRGKEVGHVLYYEFIKQEDGRFSFRIYNTGKGVEFHSHETVEFKEKYLTLAERVNIPLDSIVCLPVIKAIQELRTMPKEDEMHVWKVGDIYETILEAFGGDPSPRIYSQEDLKDRQFSGTCTFLSLTTVLSHRIENENQFLKSQFEMKLKALVDYSSNFSQNVSQPSKPNLDERSWLLLKKSLAVFTREAMKYHEAGIINDLEFHYTSQKVKMIQEQLEWTEKNYLKEIEKQSPNVTLEPGHESFPAGPLNVKPVEPVPNALTLTIPPKNFIDVSSWTPSPDKLQEDLSKFYQQLEKAQKDQNYVAALIGIQDLMSRIPFEWIDKEGNDLWKQISLEQGQATIHTLNEIAHVGFDSLMREMRNDPTRTRELQPQHLLSHLKAFTLAHKLASQYQNEISLPLSSLWDPAFITNMVNWDQSFFRLYDPNGDLAFGQIKQYWLHQERVTNRLDDKWRNKNDLLMEEVWILKEITRKPGIYEKLFDRILDFERMPNNVKAAYAISDQSANPAYGLNRSEPRYHSLPRDIFPQSYYDLRDLLYIGNYMLTSPLVPTYETHAEPLKLLFLATDYGLQMEVSGINLEAVNSYGEEQPSPEIHLRKAHRLPVNDNALGLYAQGDQKPNYTILWTRKDFETYRKFDYPLEELRNHVLMLNIGDKLQIKETLVYFLKNYKKFEDPDFRILFELLLFKPGLLIAELKNFAPEDRQQLLSTLVSFTSQNFNRYLNLGKVETASYFLYLNEIFKDYFDYAKEDMQLEWLEEKGQKPLEFLNTRAEAQKLLKDPSLTDEARSLLSYVFVLSYKNQKEFQNEEEICEFLVSVLTYKLLNLAERQKEIVLEKLLFKLGPELEKHLSGDRRDAILNKTLSILHPELSGQVQTVTWKPHPAFPLFIASNGLYIFNLEKAVLYKNQGTEAKLPRSVTSHLTVEKVFKSKGPLEVSQLNLSTYQVTTQNGETYRIILKDKDCIVQRLFVLKGQERWYQYIPAEELGLRKRGLILDGFHWYSDAPHPEVLITRTPSAPLYKIEFEKKAEQPEATKVERLNIEKVHRLDASGNETGLILLQNDRDFTSRFEDPGLVLIWKNQVGHEPELIEFPRFNLTFEIKMVKGERRAVCEDLPGYFVAKKQWLPVLKDFPHYLLLENLEGKQKVLLPLQPLQPRASFDPQAAKGGIKTDRQLGYLGQRFLEYSMDKKTGKLIPSSEEGRLYYSALSFWKMEYDTTIDYLRNSKECFLRLYTPAEAAALKPLFTNFEPTSEDADPRANAISLYSAYLFIQNFQNFKDSTNDRVARQTLGRYFGFLLKNLPFVYIDYIKQLNHVDPARLKPEEELFLIQFIDFSEISKESALPILNRLRVLDPEQGNLKMAELSLQQTGSAEPSKIDSNVRLEEPGFQLSVLEVKPEQIVTAFRSYSKPTQYILRGSLSKQFPDYYRMVKGDLDSATFNNHYTQITGLEKVPENEQQRKKELALVFSMMRKGSEPITQVLAAILETVLDQPDKFPPSNELSELISSYSWETLEVFLQEKLLNPTKAHFEKLAEEKKEPSKTEIGISDKKKRALKPQPKKAQLSELQLPYEVCVALYAPTHLMASPIESLDQYVEQTSSNVPEQDLSKTQDELVKVFDRQIKERLVQEEFKSVQTSVATHKEQQAPPTQYEIVDFQKLQTLRSQLEYQILDGESSLTGKELALLQKANKPATYETEIARQQFEAISREIKPLTIDALIQLFLQQDMELFHKANPNLSPDEISTLSHEIMDYLIHSTHLQHLQRLSGHIKSIQEAKFQKIGDEELSLIVKEFVTSASTTRAYNIESHPTYLVFEHYMGILLRKDQIQTLDLLQLKNGKLGNPKALGKVVEMIMGAGKTAVLLPLLLKMIADGDNLAFAILPEALLPSMSLELAQRLGPSFGQTVHVIEYSRDSGNTTQKLTSILLQLHQIQENREALLMTSSTIQSLYLKFVETLYEYSQSDPSISNEYLEKDIQLFREIFRFFKEKGNLIIDEADLILNARKEHHFTLGMPIPLPPYNLNSLSSLYQILNSHPDIIENVSMDFAPHSKGVPYTKEVYREKILPVLIREILSQRLGVPDIDVKEYFDDLSPAHRQYIEIYLANQADAAAFAFVEQIGNKKIKNLLALVREEIHTLLPLTNDKMCDENYGLSPLKNTLTAIPYHGSNNPAVKSQFGNQYETLNYTFQLYLKKGIPTSLVKKEIEILQKQAMLVIQRNKPLKESEPYKAFMEICGHQERFQLFGPDSQLDELTKRINEDQHLKFEFIKKFIAPEIVSYPMTLSANPQLFNFLVKRLEGFTGTLWNADTFPEGLETITGTETTAKTLTVLWKNSKDRVHTISKTEPKKFAEALMKEHPFSENAKALIDTGGLGRGLENEKAARLILDVVSKQNRVPPIKGVVFYDAADHLMILEKGKSQPVPLEQSPIPKEERITFYDQKHTTGSDIKQAFSAVGLVTVSQHTTLRNLLQSVRRMRGLDLGQKIEFIVDEDVKELILSTLEKVTDRKKEGELTLGDILLFVTYNQAILKGDNNYRALKQKMKAVLQREAFAVMLDPAVNVKDLQKLFLDVESLFVTSNVQDTWDMFGKIEQEEESGQVAQSQIQELMVSKPFHALEQNQLLAQSIDGEAVRDEVESLVQKTLNILPEKLSIGFGGYGVEAEKEAEKEVEQETQKEIEDIEDVFNKLYSRKDNISLATVDPARFFSPDFFTGITLEEIKQMIAQAPEERGIKRFDDQDTHWHLVDKGNPFVNLNLVFSTAEEFKEYANVFDPAISGSLNLFQIYNAGIKTAPYKPFDHYQKEISSFLIVENKQSGKIQFVLIDQNDEQDVKDKLIQDNQMISDDKTQATRICLYAVNYGSYLQSRDRVDIERLESSPEFLNALVQIKFMKGETSYSDHELPYLKKWIEKNDPQKMLSLFQKFTKWKPNTSAALPTSDIGDVFKEYGVVA